MREKNSTFHWFAHKNSSFVLKPNNIINIDLKVFLLQIDFIHTGSPLLWLSICNVNFVNWKKKKNIKSLFSIYESKTINRTCRAKILTRQESIVVYNERKKKIDETQLINNEEKWKQIKYHKIHKDGWYGCMRKKMKKKILSIQIMPSTPFLLKTTVCW